MRREHHLPASPVQLLELLWIFTSGFFLSNFGPADIKFWGAFSHKLWRILAIPKRYLKLFAVLWKSSLQTIGWVFTFHFNAEYGPVNLIQYLQPRTVNTTFISSCKGLVWLVRSRFTITNNEAANYRKWKLPEPINSLFRHYL